LHSTYIKFDAEREFIYTTDNQVNQVTTVFLGDKHAACFFNQIRICCNEMMIVGNLDFISELNILGATYTDEMKRKHSMTYSCAAVVAEKSQEVCGVYLNLNGISPDSAIRLTYEIIA
jgi:hypothetical protein